MATSAAGIIFSNLNNNTLSRLTRDRTVAAIPFACRYRLIDFCLSNLVNANISKIHVVANYNYRSMVEHIGSGKDWDLATLFLHSRRQQRQPLRSLLRIWKHLRA